MLTYDFDTRELTAALSRVNQQVIPRAVATGLNDTVKDVQASVRAGVASRFTVRNPGFINRLIKIGREDFARADKHEAIVRIQGPETVLGSDQRAASILTKHEEGGTFLKSPTEPFYPPSHALRPTPQTVIPRRLYPSALGISARRTIEGGFTAPSMRGKSRTFAVPIGNAKGATPGIYQREGGEGADRNDIQLLWLFVQRIKLKPRLRFYQTGNEVVTERGAQHLATALERALLRLLGRGYTYLGNG